MLKIKCPENNNFDRAKKFHRIKYFNDIDVQLSNIICGLDAKGYTSEKDLFVKIKNELTNILTGDANVLNRTITIIHSDYVAVRDNQVDIKGKNISMNKLISQIFNYRNFSNARLYQESIKKISDLKSNIKNRRRAGLTGGKFNIGELRQSIISTIHMLPAPYEGTKFAINNISTQWINKVNIFNIPNVDNITEDDLLIFEEMRLDLIYKRNEFWGSYNELKKSMSDTEIKQSWGGYSYVKEIGIMTCPYCNRTYTNLIIGTRKSYRPALDHFYSKSEYPYLALSLFNLIPSCNICNSSFKSDDNSQILNVFENGFENNYIFTYEVIDDSKSFNSDNIKIRIRPKGEICTLSEESIRLFELESTYSTHKDIVIRMYKQRKKYNNGEIKRLIRMGIYTSPANFVEQVILNGIADKDRFHELPLAKFKRDIAYQLGFLKKL